VAGVTARPDSPRYARIAAAVVAELGTPSDSHPEEEHRPELLRQVDTWEDDLPVRAVWLARLAAAAAAGGDPLGLARCRDRLLARLAADGPALDLDAPAFLRFHGAANGERFRAAREWLLHTRDPIHRWVQQQATGHRLGWAGIDPDPRTTVAYADLMLAWGLSRLGDRTRAGEWADRAEHTLTRARAHGVDRRVHVALLSRFRDRIRAAQRGRSDRPGDARQATAASLPADPLSHYAVEKLCAHSCILTESASADPYRGQDLAALLGSDPLGERLGELVRTGDPAAVTRVLDEASSDPTARVLPRVVLAVSAGAGVTPADASRLLPLFPLAVELLPEAVRLAFPPDSDARQQLGRLTARVLATGCRAAVRHDDPAAFGALVRCVIDHVRRGDEVVRVAAVKHSAALFTAVRKLGLGSLAGELAVAVGSDSPVVWLAAGNEDVGIRLLDAARERLFVVGIPDERARTEAALDYVAALGLAPPRIALGRLEELFLRLGRVTTAGATARYYALRPLELVDRAVTAVVSDEFNLGPAVRRWLEDDEFLIRTRIARDLAAAVNGT
jgi:hypothetical protein